MKAPKSIPDYGNEKGTVMIVTLAITLVLSILVPFLMATINHNVRTAGHEMRKTKALYLAEAGIERAKRVLRGTRFNAALLGPDGIAGTYDDGILNFGESVSFPIPAIICGGDLMLSGTPIIQGDNGSVHANGSIEISGSPVVSQYLTASQGF